MSLEPPPAAPPAPGRGRLERWTQNIALAACIALISSLLSTLTQLNAAVSDLRPRMEHIELQQALSYNLRDARRDQRDAARSRELLEQRIARLERHHGGGQ